MTNEELNTRLYEKMFAEQERFRDWLLSQPPAEILNHAYEYTVREDILMSLEYNDLEDSQARALLKSGKPLKQIFERWEDKETSHMENIWDTVQEPVSYTHLELAAQVLRFVGEFDGSRMGYGEDDAQAVENISQQLHDPVQREEIRRLLQSFLDLSLIHI